MEAENVLNLLDSYWYDLDFFKRSIPTKYNIIPQIPSSNINSTLPTIHTNMSSNNNNNNNNNNNSKLSDFSSSSSPNSVLQSPKLQTIFSGKESNDFDDQSQDQKSTKVNSSCCTSLKGNNNVGSSSRTRKKKRLSKSLSDLEFEELKGFMDLGFVFSEEDKDSTLVSIIPGLQRLGNNIENNNNVISSSNDKLGVSRPYLSEAWEVMLEKKKKETSLLDWKLIASNNQIDMKDYLKSWAHNVASTVK